MNDHLISLFVAVPMFAGIVLLLLHGKAMAQRVVALVFLAAMVVLAGYALGDIYEGPDVPGKVLVSQMSNWPAPFGITIAVDTLSAVMLLIADLVTFCVVLYCAFQLPKRVEQAFFYPLTLFLLFGVHWSFVTGDLFNLFVSFEIMLMSSYALFVLGTRREQIRQAYKYIVLNLIGSTLFVTCAGLLYGQLGTLNMADITRIALGGNLPPASVPIIVLLLVVFGGKTAIFPVWYWLPETYPTLPAPVGALFAGLLTKVGAYVMIRVFVMMFGSAPQVAPVIGPVILVCSGVTMFVGVLGAVSMHSVRRILSIHIISQVGYMILGIGLMTNAAVAGAIFFILNNMVVKCCLFLCGGLMRDHAGSDDLDEIGGLLRRSPWLATLFFIAALSLAGLPPFSGFFGKFMLVRESFATGRGLLAVAAIATSLFTLLSMLKIWSYGFWSPARGAHERRPGRVPSTSGGLVAVAIMVSVALSMGLGAQFYFNICMGASRSLVDPRPYIRAVLGQEHTPMSPNVVDAKHDDAVASADRREQR